MEDLAAFLISLGGVFWAVLGYSFLMPLVLAFLFVPFLKRKIEEGADKSYLVFCTLLLFLLSGPLVWIKSVQAFVGLKNEN